MEQITRLDYQTQKDGNSIYQESWFIVLFCICIILLCFACFALVKYWKDISGAIKVFYANWIFLLILRILLFVDVFADYPVPVYVALGFLPVFWITIIAPWILIYLLFRLIMRVTAIVKRKPESGENEAKRRLQKVFIGTTITGTVIYLIIYISIVATMNGVAALVMFIYLAIVTVLDVIMIILAGYRLKVKLRKSGHPIPYRARVFLILLVVVYLVWVLFWLFVIGLDHQFEDLAHHQNHYWTIIQYVVYLGLEELPFLLIAIIMYLYLNLRIPTDRMSSLLLSFDEINNSSYSISFNWEEDENKELDVLSAKN